MCLCALLHANTNLWRIVFEKKTQPRTISCIFISMLKIWNRNHMFYYYHSYNWFFRRIIFILDFILKMCSIGMTFGGAGQSGKIALEMNYKPWTLWHHHFVYRISLFIIVVVVVDGRARIFWCTRVSSVCAHSVWIIYTIIWSDCLCDRDLLFNTNIQCSQAICEMISYSYSGRASRLLLWSIGKQIARKYGNDSLCHWSLTMRLKVNDMFVSAVAFQQIMLLWVIIARIYSFEMPCATWALIRHVQFQFFCCFIPPIWWYF